MILDAIIGLFGSFFSAIAGAASSVFVPAINLVAAGIEAVVGLFVSGFTLGRVERKNSEHDSRANTAAGIVTLLAIAGFIAWLVIAPNLMKKTVTLVAADGHSLPFAAMVIHTRDGDRHERTDNAGNIVIPRFSVTALTVKDPRYVERTWEKGEIDSELTVSRTVLGSGLDSLAERLLKPTAK